MSKWSKSWDRWTNWSSPFSKKKRTDDSKTRASSYWYKDYESDFDYEDFYSDFGNTAGGYNQGDQTRLASIAKTQDLYKLASVRRAIANFVSIVTSRTDIPVRYATKSNSYTDGNTVTLSADINDHFDVGVGLALHEGSHIVLSDFDLLKGLSDFGLEYRGHWQNESARDNHPSEWERLLRGQAGTDGRFPYTLQHPSNKYLGIANALLTGEIIDWVLADRSKCRMNEVLNLCGQLCNWIEDRRIDSYIYKTAPGYRDYYLQMYAHYFGAPEIDKGQQSSEYTTEDFDSYLFRIINMTNANTDLSVLRGLRKIAELIDLKSIGRLRSTTEVYLLSVEVFRIILKSIDNPANPTKDKGKGGEQGNGSSGDAGQSDVEITDVRESDEDSQGGGGGAINPKGMNGEMTATLSSADDSTPTPSAGGTPRVKLSKSAADKLRKILDKQKKFLDDGAKKKKVSSDEEKKLNSIDESGTDLVQVGTDYNDYRHGGGLVDSKGNPVNKGVSCVVAKRLNNAMREGTDESFPFPVTERKYCTGEHYNRHTELRKSVDEGIALGTLLGNKLVVRSESRDTVFNRLNKGKIDGRMVASLGFGNESVFYTKDVDQFNKVNLHISLDYSGSMGGTKHRKMLVCAVAIVRACKIARNIDVQVSIRSTTRGNHKVLPYIGLIYDSRKDSFTEFADFVSRCGTGNTTPEGLCFEAIMRNFIPPTKEMDSYFLNISDGEPAFSTNDFSYTGDSAASHTARQVKRIREQGINVLSYFITEHGDSSNKSYYRSWELFERCYGKDAKWINVQNLSEIARTMNDLFLKKTPAHQQ